MPKARFIPISEPSLDKVELRYVTDCMKSGWVSSLGKYIPEFETKFARFSDCKYGVSVFNGTVALHLALAALGIGPGDEVIVPTLTFIATANSVLYTGATPIFVDCELDSWNMDPKDIAKKITSKTKAIIAVHLYGHPANMGAIMRLAKKHKLFVIEDAAEAHGAKYKGKKVGSIGNVGCFSFYGNKIITTGEGGIATSNNQELLEKMRFLKDHAMSTDKKYYHPLLGYNYRMTNVQAALGVAQMKKMPKFLARRNQIAKFYSRYLKDLPGIELQPQAKWATPVNWMYSILIKPESGMSRDELAIALKEKGIDSRPFFIPNHQMPYFSSRVQKQKFPVAQMLSEQGINLPSSVLLTNQEIIYITKTIKNIMTENNYNKESINFRLINTKDSRNLYNFFKSLSNKSKATFNPHPFTYSFAKKIAADSQSSLRLRIVATSNKQKIIAYAFLHRLPIFTEYGYFGIAVSDKQQGKGIGASLLKHLLDTAKKTGSKYVLLNVFANNPKATAIYKKQGFKPYNPSLFLAKLITLNELIYNGTILELFKKPNSSQKKTVTHKVIWMRKKL